MNRTGAVLVGAAIAGGIILLLRRASASVPAELSACEKAAAMAEKVRPGSGAAVLAGCALLGPVTKIGQAGAEAVGDVTSSVIGVLTGWGSRDTIDFRKCPEGSHGDMLSTVRSHLGFAEGESNRGARCIDDKTGATVGYLDPSGFHPFAVDDNNVAPPPTVGTLATTGTTSSREGRWSGGVNVS